MLLGMGRCLRGCGGGEGSEDSECASEHRGCGRKKREGIQMDAGCRKRRRKGMLTWTYHRSPSYIHEGPAARRHVMAAHGERSPSTLTRRSAKFGAHEMAARREREQCLPRRVHVSSLCTVHEDAVCRRPVKAGMSLADGPGRMSTNITARRSMGGGCDLHHRRRRVAGRHREETALDARTLSMLHNVSSVTGLMSLYDYSEAGSGPVCQLI